MEAAPLPERPPPSVRTFPFANAAGAPLGAGLGRAADDPLAHVEALVYRAELAVVLDEPAVARELLERAGAVPLSEDGRERLAATLRHAGDLAAAGD